MRKGIVRKGEMKKGKVGKDELKKGGRNEDFTHTICISCVVICISNEIFQSQLIYLIEQWLTGSTFIC